MSSDEARIREIAERRRKETDDVDHASLARTVVAKEVTIPNFDTKETRGFLRHAVQIMDHDPDIPAVEGVIADNSKLRLPHWPDRPSSTQAA